MKTSPKTETQLDTGREGTQPLSLYLHIPFCIRKCRYCDFLSAPSCGEEQEAYTQALCREIRMTAEAVGSGLHREVDTIFFGGGTPSLLTTAQLEKLLEMIRSCYSVRENAEISLEANPGTVDPGKLRAFHKLGINRLSLGIQSFRDEELALLGRIHSAEEAVRTCLEVREAGFENWSLDLMSGLPGQTLSDWMETLRKAADLEPAHLSAYSLIIEEGTPLEAMLSSGQLPPLPTEETDRAMVHETTAFLSSRGMMRYEISNYARPGFESRHNTGYWTGHEYLGLGLGASSLAGGHRIRNTADMRRYLEIYSEETGAFPCTVEEAAADDSGKIYEQLRMAREEENVLSTKDRMEEFMFLGLRMTRGVSSSDFFHRFRVPLRGIYGEVLDRQLAAGLLRQDGNRYFLTEDGLDVSNVLMAEYLL